MKKINELAIGFCLLFATVCPAQTLHSYGAQSPLLIPPPATGMYFCQANVPATVAWLHLQVPNVPGSMPLLQPGGAQPAYTSPHCIDLSNDHGAVSIIMHREKLHAELIAELKRQADASDRVAKQLETWMKKAEQDLRAAIDAKFKDLPLEIAANPVFKGNLEKLRVDILKEVDCKQDPTKCD